MAPSQSTFYAGLEMPGSGATLEHGSRYGKYYGQAACPKVRWFTSEKKYPWYQCGTAFAFLSCFSASTKPLAPRTLPRIACPKLVFE